MVGVQKYSFASLAYPHHDLTVALRLTLVVVSFALSHRSATSSTSVQQSEKDVISPVVGNSRQLQQQQQQQQTVDNSKVISVMGAGDNAVSNNEQTCPNQTFDRRNGPIYAAFQLPESEAGTVITYEAGQVFRNVLAGDCYVSSWSEHAFACLSNDSGEMRFAQTSGYWPVALGLPEGCVNGVGGMNNAEQTNLLVDNNLQLEAPVASPEVYVIRPIQVDTDAPTVSPIVATANPTLKPTVATITTTLSPSPVAAAISTVTESSIYCGCRECTQSIWDTLADASTCGERIAFLMGGGVPVVDACRQVAAEEHPDICGSCFCVKDGGEYTIRPLSSPTTQDVLSEEEEVEVEESPVINTEPELTAGGSFSSESTAEANAANSPSGDAFVRLEDENDSSPSFIVSSAAFSTSISMRRWSPALFVAALGTVL